MTNSRSLGWNDNEAITVVTSDAVTDHISLPPCYPPKQKKIKNKKQQKRTTKFEYVQVPDANLAAKTSGCQDVVAVRMKRDAPRRTRMARQRADALVRPQIGHVDVVVAVRRRHFQSVKKNSIEIQQFVQKNSILLPIWTENHQKGGPGIPR